jgi:hypothetical protein
MFVSIPYLIFNVAKPTNTSIMLMIQKRILAFGVVVTCASPPHM